MVNTYRFQTKLLFMAVSTLALMTRVSNAAVPESIPGQFVVEMRAGANLMSASELSERLQSKIIDNVRENVVLVQRSVIEKPSASIEMLQSSQYVVLAEPNYIYRMVRAPNDTDYGRLWGMRNTGQIDSKGGKGVTGVDIGAERAWDITTGSKSVVVAVIDTGVDFSIADLAPNSWVNQAEANGLPGVDDDHNGFVDDVYGWDFAGNAPNGVDDNNHGSHCSGTIGAKGGDGAGVAGVNWDVSIMAVKFLDAEGSGSLANAVKAIDYARKMGAKVMSNSWGGGGASAVMKKAIEDARDAGILFVAAAGNDSSDNDTTPTYPASYAVSNVLAVAALDNRGEMAYFSNWGATTVHVAAPGVNIVSTTPAGLESYSGTSMATPHVAGIAALLLSANPTWKWQELKTRIIASARPLATLRGRVVSGGIADAYYALTGLTPPRDPNDPSAWAGHSSYRLSSPHPYVDKFEDVYTVKIPGAKRMAVHFSRFETENGYDKVQFENGSGDVAGVLSGQLGDRFSPIIEGDTMVIRFSSDDTVHLYGFDVDQVAYEN